MRTELLSVIENFFNEINKSAEILVPLNMIETFHAENTIAVLLTFQLYLLWKQTE